MKWCVYDIETIVNCFTCTIYDYELNNFIVFEISDRKNDLALVKNYFKNKNLTCVTFNGIGFDDLVINYILLSKGDYLSANSIYKISQQIIKEQDDWYNTELKYLSKNIPFKQLDLFRYWSKMLRLSKKLSLKYFASNLGLPIVEMSHPHYEKIEESKIDELLFYNKNDVIVTKELAKALEKEIKLRFYIKSEYGLDCLSMDAPKIASEIFAKEVSRKTGQTLYDVKSRRYEPGDFKIGDYLPKVEFKTLEFQELYQRYCKSTNYYKEDFLFTNSDGSNVMLNFAIGGLHNKFEEQYFESDEHNQLVTSDIASLYPNLLINYKFVHPDIAEHVLEIYTKIKNDRIEAKKSGNKTKDTVLKLLLNGISGILDQKVSWMYSPEYILALRITGQMLLARCAEECKINGWKSISYNTDGVEVLVPKLELDRYYKIMNSVASEFNLEFEHEFYNKIYYNNVNNYLGLTASGKLKEKGEFVSEFILDKSNNFNIIYLAFKEYFTNDTFDVETFIKSNTDIMNFCASQKVSKKYDVYYGNDKVQQLNRYYASNKGLYLTKKSKDLKERKNNKTGKVDHLQPKHENLLKGCKVTIENDYPKDISNYNIRYGYYIEKFNGIKGKKEKLTLF